MPQIHPYKREPCCVRALTKVLGIMSQTKKETRQGGSKQQEKTRGWAGPGLSGDSNKSPLPRLYVGTCARAIANGGMPTRTTGCGVCKAKLEDDGNRVLVLAWPAYQEMRIMGLLAISYGDSAKGCSRGQTQARSGSWATGDGVVVPAFRP